MIIEVVGLKKANFTGSDGNTVNGVTLYYTAEGQPNVVGLEAGRIFVTTEKLRQLGLSTVTEGSYELFYNRYGKVDILKQI